MCDTKKIGIVGHTGMTGEMIERDLQSHQGVEVVYIKNSKGEEGKLEDCDLVFLATKHDISMEEAPRILGLDKKVIDLSGAFRIPVEQFEGWYEDKDGNLMKHTCSELIQQAVYGMPAFNADAIRHAQLVANPGCYSTAIILATRPLAKYHIEGPLRMDATSGISGAGKNVQEPNEQTYKIGREHQHVPEVELYSGMYVKKLNTAVLRSVYNGINANIEARLQEDLRWVPAEQAEQTLRQAISDAYTPEDDVHVVIDTPPKKVWGTADVTGTNKANIKLRVEGDTVYITSMIDNLGKGAVSQAIENMNLMLGFDRHAGLDSYLK